MTTRHPGEVPEGPADPYRHPSATGPWHRLDTDSDTDLDTDLDPELDIDADGDGVDDTAVVHGASELALFTDTDGDGLADQVLRIGPDAGLTGGLLATPAEVRSESMPDRDLGRSLEPGVVDPTGLFDALFGDLFDGPDPDR